MKKLLLYFFILWGSLVFSQLYQVPIYSVSSLQPGQPGSEVAKLLDGDNTTIYHSKWSQNGIPDELKFYFTSNVTSIKKLVYTPRQSGTNGMWTNISISYSTQGAPNTFISVSNNLIWASNAQDKEVVFPTAILNPYVIKISVNAGIGNYSSGAEIKFFLKHNLRLLTVQTVPSIHQN
ncbi:discoidin domain-containing protein [Chryseobacterium carnipullorum]|uniref:F5/8 type C domain n=1 Tax=Chryseobacterium carnipullorum TaxID=1124835 RepID=A0A376DZ92_CHRCU|nr:discoidin domain-containing protein [Chryseobacterium carnipullorum]STC98722.1 F5/8 type C domain [Chryseobacterium carnipullorum]